MENREEFVTSLYSFYENNGIVASNFRCKFFENCLSIAIKNNRNILGKGAQAHIGNKYSEDIRVLVLSLDTGGGGSDTIEERVQTIEQVQYERTNQHMRGTIELLRAIYIGKTDDECLKLFSMTNAAKCSGTEQDKMPTRLYENCSGFHKEEINLLKPNIIISEGTDAYPYFLNRVALNDDDFHDFWNYLGIGNEDIKLVLKRILLNYIQKVKLNMEFSTLLIHVPHPSSRQGQWQVFRTTSLPIISLYVNYLRGTIFKEIGPNTI